MEPPPGGARVDQAADQRRNLGRVNPEGLGSATHLHARPLEVEVGIDPHREVRGEAEMIRDRERASGLARRFKIERRSEEHTSELQSLMRISYAVFCLKKKNTTNRITTK